MGLVRAPGNKQKESQVIYVCIMMIKGHKNEEIIAKTKIYKHAKPITMK